MKVSRRSFLKYCAASTAALATSRYFQLAQTQERLPETIEIVRSTCSANCTGACGFHAMVYKGKISALVQSADYPEEEYNPRGCLRGQSTLNLIYGPDRLKYPLIRTGKRGEGKFKAVSWDEALNYVTDRLAEIVKTLGPESVAASIQVPGTGYVHKGALMRLSSIFGFSVLHAYTMNGDLPIFWPMTFGVQTEELEPLEWLNSKYTAIFGSNILFTRLPDAKFLTLGQERGGKIIVVDPNYSATASKADEWIQINPATDAAFALGIVHVILNEKLYNEDFIKTYTDLPLLVRLDSKKKLKAEEVKDLNVRAATLKRNIPEHRELYVVFDKNTGKLHIPDPENLERNFDPLLEAELEVELITGEKVKVKSVFQLLKDEIEREYSPEQVARIVCPDEKRTDEYVEAIERLAREMATIKPLHIVYGASNYQWFHGDLKGRALSLIVVLTGNIGKPGAGISTYAGQYRIRWPLASWWNFGEKKNKWVTFLLWLNEDYRMSEEFKKYNKETPYPENDVKALIFGWHNPFDQHNLANKLIEKATNGELELIVATDFQMTTSCLWSDVVLPGVCWYEKYELTATPVLPYVQLQKPAIEPLFESMPEIWIFKEIARKLAERLGGEAVREVEEFYPDAEIFKREEDARINNTWSLKFAREIANQASLDAIKLLLEKGGELVENITLDDLMEGPVRLNLPTPDKRQLMFWEQVEQKKPFPPVSYPAPLPKTARFVKSGRVEFYKDEDVFIDSGETLPVHKDPFVDTENKMAASKEYKFALITRNSLYRVHSTHSNNLTMLELQDFRARVWVNPKTLSEKGIDDGDLVEVFNDRGKFYGYAVSDPGLHPKILIFEQGWWSRYLRGSSYNTPLYPWIKSNQVTYFVPGIWEPTTAWNEVACDFRKVEG